MLMLMSEDLSYKLMVDGDDFIDADAEEDE